MTRPGLVRGMGQYYQRLEGRDPQKGTALDTVLEHRQCRSHGGAGEVDAYQRDCAHSVPPRAQTDGRRLKVNSLEQHQRSLAVKLQLHALDLPCHYRHSM
jgi:hypothetical protein